MVKPLLTTYKRLLILAKRLPTSDRTSAIQQIRTAFRESKNEQSEIR